MLSLTNILKYLAPYNTIKMKLILDKGIDAIDLMIADEMKHLNDIEMKLMMEEGKIRIKRLWNDLSEFEMNVLEIKIDADTGISKNEENKIKITIDCLKRSELFKKY